MTYLHFNNLNNDKRFIAYRRICLFDNKQLSCILRLSKDMLNTSCSVLAPNHSNQTLLFLIETVCGVLHVLHVRSTHTLWQWSCLVMLLCIIRDLRKYKKFIMEDTLLINQIHYLCDPAVNTWGVSYPHDWACPLFPLCSYSTLKGKATVSLRR